MEAFSFEEHQSSDRSSMGLGIGKKIGYKINNLLRRWLNNIDILGKKPLQIEDQIRADNPWEKLPKDIMEAIALKLNLNDYINSSSVCKSWRYLLLKSDILRPQFPWLLFPHDPSSDHIKFYNVLEKKYLTFTLPECVDGRKLVGCSKGWVVFMTKPTSEISLFNPIFGVTRHLPSLPTTSSYLQRVELSSSNVSDCKVAAIFDNFEKIALCELGGDCERWEVLPIEVGCRLIDVLFCKEKLHVLIKSETGNGKIENVVVKLPNCGEAIPIVLVHDLNYKNCNEVVEVDNLMPPSSGFKVFLRNFHISYLAESIKGRVLLIQKHHCIFHIVRDEQVNMIHEYFDRINNGHNTNDDDNDDDLYVEEEYIELNVGEEYVEARNEEEVEDGEEVETLEFLEVVNNLDGFKIYEIEDLKRNKKVCKGLGKEETLFLSSKSRLCLASNNASNRLQGNSIHFLMDYAKVLEDYGLFFIGFNGIHHLEDSSIHDLIPELRIFWNSKFIWFAPNLII